MTRDKLDRNRFVHTLLVSSAGKLEKLPAESLPEVAFAGRSNVGKSSLLNALSDRRNLFKVGKTPGRTRTIIHVEARTAEGLQLYLVDLPGYGFAKVAQGARRNWGRLIETYLGSRATLELVVLLVDVRRGVEHEEQALLDTLAELGVSALLVATKIDRLPKNKRQTAIAALERATDGRVLTTSATTGEGLEKLRAAVARACAPQVAPEESAT